MALVKGGIVQVAPDTGQVLNVIALQYNPDTVTRSLQVQGVGTESGPHVDQLRLKGPPIETYKIDVEIDATDRLEHPDRDPTVKSTGIAPQIAVLELLIYPTSDQLVRADQRTRAGSLEIVPMDAPLALFVWNASRIIPVRITEFSVTEEAFDASLNPIRAKISIGMRVLSVDDLGFSSLGGSLYLTYQRRKEQMAEGVHGVALSALGITGIQ
jgi:hypothetical protein